MRTAMRIADVALAVARVKIKGKRVGFVPTMGAIHEGHLSLIEIAKQHCDFVVASIFVNPLQFNNPEDFALYPRNEKSDAKALEKAGVDLLFLPAVDEIYPNGKPSITEYSGELGRAFEGAARPGHFDGMLTVVSRLFDIVQPDVAVFGAKDAQQLFLVKQMVEVQNQKGTRDPIQIIEAPTVRDSNGLALSSRNRRLSRQQLGVAVLISKSLRVIEGQARLGAAPEQALAKARLIYEENPEAKLEYLALVNPESFNLIDDEFTGQALAIVAATIGEVRLIDNLLVTFKERQ